MPAVAFDPLEYGLHLLRRRAIDAVYDQLIVPEDGVERRAQLMAHAGEELRLVLARLRELAALVLDFVEQANILDRNGGLVGEGLDQRDLLVGERLNMCLDQPYDALRDAVTQHRDCQHRPEREHPLRLAEAIFVVRGDVLNLHGSALKKGAADGGAATGMDRGALPQLQEFLRHIVGGHCTADSP